MATNLSIDPELIERALEVSGIRHRYGAQEVYTRWAIEAEKQWLRRERELGQELLVRTGRLELAAGCAEVRLRMHPDDLALLGPQVEQLAAELARLGTAQIVPDPNVTRGGCRIETESGLVDATIPTQLDEIRRQLLDTEL